MPIKSIERLYDASDPPVEIGIRLNGCGPNGFVEGYYADITGNRNNPQWWAKMTARVQDMIDVRIRLDDDQFKEDGVVVDPDALTDPARPDFFWDGDPPNGYLVARTILISDVSWDDGRVPPLQFTLSKVR